MNLTCVTAVYNAIRAGNRERLIRCVESVAKLKTEHEHLIYDGASTDGTVELLRELEAKTPGLKVVSEPDTGIYNALNKGVRDAKGEWFYVLGCDDYVCCPDVLDRLLSRSQDADVFVTSVNRMTQEGFNVWRADVGEMNGIFLWPCVCHQGEVMRTALVHQLGGFDEQYRIAADSDMLFRAHLQNVRFEYLPEVFAYFECGGLAASHLDKALWEHRLSVANVLKLDEKEKSFMIEAWLLPYHVLLNLMWHKDIAIRQSARKMLVSRFKRMVLRLWAPVRLLLYPIVVVTRPLRHKGCDKP